MSKRVKSTTVEKKVEKALNDADNWVPSLKKISFKTNIVKPTVHAYLKNHSDSIKKRREAIRGAIKDLK